MRCPPQQVQIGCYPIIQLLIAYIALWIADYIETLPAEIHTIWLKKQMGTSFLFVLNRYIFLIQLVLQWVPDLSGSNTDNQLGALLLP